MRELAQHMATRIGIHTGCALDSDHSPVVCDFPIDCARVALDICPVWSPTVVHKFTVHEDCSDCDIAAFNERLGENLQTTDLVGSGADLYRQVNTAILTAATGTIGSYKKLKYPKFVANLKHYTSQHYAMRAWRKHIRAALHALPG